MFSRASWSGSVIGSGSGLSGRMFAIPHATAVEYCKQALGLSLQVGNAYGQANTWDSLGYAQHHLGDHRQAIASYQQAIDLFEGMGDRHAEAIVLDHLGNTLHAAGDTESTRESW